MAITQSALTSGSDNTNSTSYATASVSPTADRLQIFAIASLASTVGNAAPPTGVSGAGLTFTQIGTRDDTGSGMSLSLWRATAASPSTGAITATFTNSQARGAWSLFEMDGADITGTNAANAIVQFVSNSDNSATVATITATLAAFGSANNGAVSAHAWFNAAGSTPTATPDTGWTEIHDTGQVEAPYAYAIESQWRADNDTTALATWSANGAVYAVAVEIKAATVASPVVLAWITA